LENEKIERILCRKAKVRVRGGVWVKSGSVREKGGVDSKGKG